MILKQGIIALIQFFLKLSAAFLRNFSAGFIEEFRAADKAEEETGRDEDAR